MPQHWEFRCKAKLFPTVWNLSRALTAQHYSTARRQQCALTANACDSTKKDTKRTVYTTKACTAQYSTAQHSTWETRGNTASQLRIAAEAASGERGWRCIQRTPEPSPECKILRQPSRCTALHSAHGLALPRGHRLEKAPGIYERQGRLRWARQRGRTWKVG